MATERTGSALMIVPTYNERENLVPLVTLLRRVPGNIHVLVVDDHSPDGTGEIADALAAADECVHVLHRAGKLGLGTAYKSGFSYALAHGYDFVCTMDADFSHDPENLPLLLDKAGLGYDLVVGSRYVAGGRTVGSTRTRRLVSHSANWLARVLLGMAVRDCTAGFRCYRRHALEAIDLTTVISSGYSFLVEMAFHCQQAGLRIGEVPITFVNRTRGASKISKAEIFKAMRTLLRLRSRARGWDR